MIAALHAAHLPVIAAIHARAFPPGARWNEAAFATLFASAGVQGWLDDRGGFILYRRAADEADLLTLAVLPGQRRQGIGAALLVFSLAGLAGQGIVRVILEVAPTNTAAMALYRREGFTQIGRRPAYYADGANAIVMRHVIAIAGG